MITPFTYGEFYYQASLWREPRRVVFKIEKLYNKMTHIYTFIVTNMEIEAYQVANYYCNRGRMENFFGEGKDGFDFALVSSKSKVVNADRLQLQALVYNIFSWFCCLALPKHMASHLIDTVRLKLLKVAAKVMHSGSVVCPFLNIPHSLH